MDNECGFTENDIQAFAGGAPGSAAGESFAAHLVGCNKCSREIEDYRKIETAAKGLYASKPEAEAAVPAEKWDGMLEKINAGIDAEPSHPEVPQYFRLSLFKVLATAAIILLAVVLAVFMPGEEKDSRIEINECSLDYDISIDAAGDAIVISLDRISEEDRES